MNPEELRELRVVLNALANQHGLLQWVNGWAYGRNEGGGYVSLFNDRLQYRVCTVYEERFRELPAFIRDTLPADGDGVEISTDRTVLERKGLLKPCTPFQIARYSVGEGDKAAWRFSGVVRVAQEKHEATQRVPGEKREEESPAPPEPVVVSPLAFTSKQDAIHYGVQRGVYPSYEASEQAYGALRAALKPTSSAEMFTAWVNQVEGIAATQRDFERGKAQPGPPASKRMSERVKAQPAYAG